MRNTGHGGLQNAADGTDLPHIAHIFCRDLADIAEKQLHEGDYSIVTASLSRLQIADASLERYRITVDGGRKVQAEVGG
jgi:hypothetical protein